MKSKGKSKSTPNKEPNLSAGLVTRGMTRHFAEASWRVVLTFLVLGVPAWYVDHKFRLGGKMLFLSLILSSYLALRLVHIYNKQYFPDSFGSSGVGK